MASSSSTASPTPTIIAPADPPSSRTNRALGMLGRIVATWLVFALVAFTDGWLQVIVAVLVAVVVWVSYPAVVDRYRLWRAERDARVTTSSTTATRPPSTWLRTLMGLVAGLFVGVFAAIGTIAVMNSITPTLTTNVPAGIITGATWVLAFLVLAFFVMLGAYFARPKS